MDCCEFEASLGNRLNSRSSWTGMSPCFIKVGLGRRNLGRIVKRHLCHYFFTKYISRHRREAFGSQDFWTVGSSIYMHSQPPLGYGFRSRETPPESYCNWKLVFNLLCTEIPSGRIHSKNCFLQRYVIHSFTSLSYLEVIIHGILSLVWKSLQLFFCQYNFKPHRIVSWGNIFEKGV